MMKYWYIIVIIILLYHNYNDITLIVPNTTKLVIAIMRLAILETKVL